MIYQLPIIKRKSVAEVGFTKKRRKEKLKQAQ